MKLENKNISQLKKHFWKIFSQYIRQKGADWNGNQTCYTCGLTRHWKKLQGGHCIPRAACGIELYFDEMNVKPQCFRCNINLGGNGAEFRRRLVMEYGEKEVEFMWAKKQLNKKWSKKDYIKKIEEYKLKKL